MDLRLRHPPCEILRELLLQRAQGTDPDDNDDWPVFAQDSLPDSPNNALGLTDTEGRTSARIHFGDVFEVYGVHILIRAVDLSGYADKVAPLTRDLDAVHRYELQVDSTFYRINSIYRQGTIKRLGKERDGGQRFLWAVDVIMSIDVLGEDSNTGTGSGSGT